MEATASYLLMQQNRDRDIYSNDILLDEKLFKENHGNILIYDISCKTSTGAKPLRFMFDKIDGFIKVCNRIYIFSITWLLVEWQNL